jgi:hypothetical protein
MAGSVFEDDGFQQRRPRNFFPVKGFRMDLGFVPSLFVFIAGSFVWLARVN